MSTTVVGTPYHNYIVASGTDQNSAISVQSGDVVIICATDNSNMPSAANCALAGGNLGAAVQTQLSSVGGTSSAIFTGTVTGSGTLHFDVTSAGLDMSVGCIVLRGLSSATPHKKGSVAPTGTPATISVSLTPTVLTTLIAYYGNVSVANFSSWLLSATQAYFEATQEDGASYLLDQAASTYAPGLNSTGTVTNACLIVLAMPVTNGPSISVQPSTQTIHEGQTATFSVTASASAGSLTYQWKKNGVDIGGATSSSYTTPTETFSDNLAIFSVVVTDSNGSLTSDGAYLVVRHTGKPWLLKA